MRISLRTQYSNFLDGLMDTQSRLMDLNQQASSQKRITKPSDDPVGTARVLKYRASIAGIDQYRSNIDTAKGWLGLADESMMQVSTILTQVKGLAEQGATGTMDAKDREATADQVRQLFGQLVNLANTRYEGNSIFGGHKFEDSAFEQGLMVYDQDGTNLGLASGASDRSIMVQFVGAEGTSTTVGSGSIACRYSSDGGDTWTDTTVGTDGVLNAGGVTVQLAAGFPVEFSPSTNLSATVGTWLTIAPTAIYQGDHEAQTAMTYEAGSAAITAMPLSGFTGTTEIQVVSGSLGGTLTYQYRQAGSSTWLPTTAASVDTSTGHAVLQTPYGAVRLAGPAGEDASGLVMTAHPGQTGVLCQGATVNAVASGSFDGDVMVRVTNSPSVNIGSGANIAYDYSLDGGVNWSTGHVSANDASPAELLVPGGKVELSDRGGAVNVPEGAQFVIHPQQASHNVEISDGEFIQLNNIGSEIFGGYYQYGSEPVFADSDPSKNIMVAVGKLVAALENNNQSGCAAALDDLQQGQEYFTTSMASVGARESRLDVADTVLSGLKVNETERMSNIEDVDVATLMTELSNQQMTYEAVLKTSSMIMKMSLVNYL